MGTKPPIEEVRAGEFGGYPVDSSESATDGRPEAACASPNGLASPGLLCIDALFDGRDCLVRWGER